MVASRRPEQFERCNSELLSAGTAAAQSASYALHPCRAMPDLPSPVGSAVREIEWNTLQNFGDGDHGTSKVLPAHSSQDLLCSACLLCASPHRIALAFLVGVQAVGTDDKNEAFLVRCRATPWPICRAYAFELMRGGGCHAGEHKEDTGWHQGGARSTPADESAGGGRVRVGFRRVRG